jgi:hypothetical protein
MVEMRGLALHADGDDGLVLLAACFAQRAGLRERGARARRSATGHGACFDRPRLAASVTLAR